MATNEPVRTIGVSNGVVDKEDQDVRFTLDTENGPLNLVANFGAIQQILAALAPMAAALRESLDRPGASYASSAEAVAEANVAIERFDRLVVLLLVTDKGVPHTFSMPPDAADEIAARLRKESKRLRTQSAGRA